MNVQIEMKEGRVASKAKADKAQAEVDAVHAAIRRKHETHDRTEIDRVVATEDGGDLSVRTVDGKLYLAFAGKELVLDRQGVIELRRQLDVAFQAVS